VSESNQGFVEIMALAVGAVIVVALFVWRRPRLAAIVALSAAVWWALQVPGLVVVATAVGLALALWRLLAPHSFRRWVSAPLARTVGGDGIGGCGRR
jgi:hypothetical protein